MACRESTSADDLLRLVVSPSGNVVVDYRSKLPGRGCHVHFQRPCIEKISRKPGILQGALKVEVRVDALEKTIIASVHQAVADGLSMAAAAGALLGGQQRLLQGLRNDEIAEIVFSADAAERTTRALADANISNLSQTVLPFTTEELGQQVGKGARAALGIRHSGASKYLRQQLRRIRSLG